MAILKTKKQILEAKKQVGSQRKEAFSLISTVFRSSMNQEEWNVLYDLLKLAKTSELENILENCLQGNQDKALKLKAEANKYNVIDKEVITFSDRSKRAKIYQGIEKLVQQLWLPDELLTMYEEKLEEAEKLTLQA